MNKTWKTEIAKENLEVLSEYSAKADKWRKNSFILEDARFGKLLSTAEENELLLLRQAPLNIPIATAISDTAEALMVQNRPTPHVAPLPFPYDEKRSEISRKIANKFKFVIQRDWGNALGSLQHDRVLTDQGIVGHGLWYVVPRFEYGEFQVDMKRLPWRYFFPDPQAKDLFYYESENQIYAVPVSKKYAFRYVKAIEPELTEEEFEEDWIKGDYADRGAAFYEDPKYTAGSNKGMALLNIRMSLEEQTIYVPVPLKPIRDFRFKTYTDPTDKELMELVRTGAVRVEESKDMYLCHYPAIGNRGYKQVYPVNNYNVIPSVYDHRDTPYPYGRMWYLYGLNRAFIKFILSTILNMALLNTTRVLAEEESIIDTDDWIMSSTVPNAILRYRLPIPGVSRPPEVIKQEPLTDAFLSMPRFLLMLMEFISGMTGVMRGDGESSPSVFATVASLQAMGGSKIKRRQAGVDATLSEVGKITAQFYQHYAPPNGYGSTYDLTEDKQIIEKYNELELKDVPDENGGMRKKLITLPESDLSKGIQTVRFTSQVSSGYEAATQAQSLSVLATQLGVKELVPEILKLHNIGNVDEIVKKLESRESAEAELQGAKKAIGELESRTKVFQNQIFQLTRTLEGVRAKGSADELLATLREQIKNITKGIGTNG